MTDALPPHYYLHNFRFVMDWVADQHGDLLTPEESAFIQTFHQLDQDGQCLLVRMLGRKGCWFRADKLRYAEIEDHARAAEQLVCGELISLDAPLSLEELASILTKPELLTLFADHLRSYKNQRKDVLVELLREHYPAPVSWTEWTRNQLAPLYRLEVQHLSDTLQLLFFGNAYQDLTEFVLQDLGLYRYESYVIDRQHRIFKNRDELDQYRQLILLREQFEVAESLIELQQLLPLLPQPSSNAAMERRRAKLINQLAYQLERHGEITAALELYRQVSLPPSRERQIRLLEKSGEYEVAWALLQDVLANPATEHEVQLAQRMAPRLAKKIRVDFSSPARQTIQEQQLILPRLLDESGNPLSVEVIAQDYFDEDTAPCVYAENLLLNGLFGLWLWPEMFRSINGAFAHPFQGAPLDMYQEDFLLNRPDITELWQLFDQDRHIEHIKHVWKEKTGITNHFVHWQFLDESLVDLALTCIPAAHLKNIFQRLLFDIKANRSGLPDLIQFFPAQKTYRLIEVKGPGDRLQDNQLRWLDFFARHEIPAEVCYVSWQ